MTSWLWPVDLRLDLAMLALAFLLDMTVPDPPTRLHPVGWIGKTIAFLERRAPVKGRLAPLLAGLGIAVAVPALFAVAAGWLGVGLYQLGAVAYVVVGAMLLKCTFTVRGLRQASLATSRNLKDGDLPEARRSLRNLVSRDPSDLSPTLVAGAAVESVAENTTDGHLGPWLAFAVLGLPGAFAYRAINTLDSMIGYRGRYEYLGKASARLDDLVNLIPARISAMLLVAAGAAMRFSPARALRVLRKDRLQTASPNAGWTMSAMSGLLGVRLDKPGFYCLGEGLREPAAGDIDRAAAIMTLAAVLGVLLAAGLLALRHGLLG